VLAAGDSERRLGNQQGYRLKPFSFDEIYFEKELGHGGLSTTERVWVSQSASGKDLLKIQSTPHRKVVTPVAGGAACLVFL